jgi:hypothetical protein
MTYVLIVKFMVEQPMATFTVNYMVYTTISSN